MSQGLGAGVRGRLSFIIPVYNYAHFLRACVERVRAQSVDDVEVVVVDDGSPDAGASGAASRRRRCACPWGGAGARRSRARRVARARGTLACAAWSRAISSCQNKVNRRRKRGRSPSSVFTQNWYSA